MQIISKKFQDDLAAVRDYTIRTVVDSPVRITPSALEKMLTEYFRHGQKADQICDQGVGGWR